MKSAIAPLLLLPALVPFGCSSRGAPSELRVSGHVEATEVRIAAKVGGRIEALPVKEGDEVRSGAEVARIDAVDIQLALEAARAERNQAEAEWKLRVAGARREEIEESQAVADQRRADFQAAELDFKRMQGLLDSGSGTTKARDDALARRDSAAAALRAAQERLKQLQAGSRKEEIASARARLEAAQARIGQLEQQMRDAVIVSPVTGIVTEKLAEQGELVQPGTALMIVTDLAGAWLTTYVSEPDLSRIRLGQPVEVHTDSGQKRRGTLSFVATQAEFTPKNVQTRDERVKLVFRVKVQLDNADGLFKPGMPAEAVFGKAEKTP